MDEGRPLVVRRPDSKFTLANFFRAQLYSTMATLKIGMDILAAEGVAICIKTFTISFCIISVSLIRYIIFIFLEK